jgi:hypothetical protein
VTCQVETNTSDHRTGDLRTKAFAAERHLTIVAKAFEESQLVALLKFDIEAKLVAQTAIAQRGARGV